MKKFYILTTLLFTVNLLATAQTAPGIQWQKCLGGSLNELTASVKQTYDSGYIVAGSSYSNDGDVTDNHNLFGNQFFDYWIVKLNNSGIIQWQKSLGGNLDDVAQDIEQTSDSGYIVVGRTNSFDGDVSGNHDPTGQFSDYWVVKISDSGSIEWTKTLGGSSDDVGYSIAQTSDGGYIVAGTGYSTDGDATGNHGLGDYWIIKLNSSGVIEWQKSFGGSSYEEVPSIKQTSDDGYIIAGRSQSNDGDVSGNHGGYDYWIVKINSTGTIQWQKSFGGSADDYATSVEQTSDDGYVVAGFSNSNDGDVTNSFGSYDYWIVKISSTGTIQWQKSFGGSSGEYYPTIKQTSDAGYIVAGSAFSNDGDVSGNHGGNGDSWIVKLNGDGIIQWQKCLGGSSGDGASSIGLTTDNGYIIAGGSGSNDDDVSGNHGGGDYWIVKLEPDALLPVSLINFSGEVNGKQNLLHWSTASEHNNTGFGVQRSNDGYSFNKVGFVNTKAANGNSDLKLNYDFSDIGFASTNYYRLKQIDKDGKFTYSNIVVLKDNNIPANAGISLYPNPVKNTLNIKIAAVNNENVTLLITNVFGKTMLAKSTFAGNGDTIIQLDVSQLAAGTYFLKIINTNEGENKMIKFIKQ